MTFNLDDYEPVAARIARFYADHPTGAIHSEIVFDDGTRVVIRATVFRDIADTIPSGVDYAEEILTDRGVNSTSRIENCSTSAQGRALAAIGYASSDWTKKASREEMAKVNRAGGADPDSGNNNRGHRPAPPRTFPNKFAKPCVHCGEIVPEGEGLSWKDGDKYKTSHREGDCDMEAPF